MLAEKFLENVTFFGSEALGPRLAASFLFVLRLSFVFSSAPTPNLMFSAARSGSLSDCVMFNCVKWFGLKYRDLVHQPIQPCHAPGDSMDRFVSSLF